MELICAVMNYFSLIRLQLSGSDLEEFLLSQYTELHKYHFGLGTWIRNNILSKDMSLVKLFEKCGIDDHDDMSAFIINMYYIISKSTEVIVS